MAKSKDTRANSAPAGERVSACRQRVGPTVVEWRAALGKATDLPADSPPDVRRTADADVCLTSRSAYLDYFTWVVVRGEGDEGVEQEIDALFRQSLAALDGSKLLKSVNERYEDFRQLQKRARGQSSSRLAFSSLTG